MTAVSALQCKARDMQGQLKPNALAHMCPYMRGDVHKTFSNEAIGHRSSYRWLDLRVQSQTLKAESKMPVREAG